MPERLHGLEVPVDTDDRDQALRSAAARALAVAPREILAVEPTKRSLDARRRRAVPSWVFTAQVWVQGEEDDYRAFVAARDERLGADYRPFAIGRAKPKSRPIVVGTGPAGLFAALTLAENGVPCTVLERGKALSKRHIDVRTFRRRGELHADSNLCFGEGGAGTYSDGKLYTRKHHPLVRAVYERLVAYGATPSILVDAHPHIGTNKLYAVLDGLRESLLDLGCTVEFESKVNGLVVRDGEVVGVRLADGRELLGGPVMLATGHSARDIYEMLHATGVPMVAKSFAIGARCEHPQALVDEVQLGKARTYPDVEAAEYFLSCRVGERGVYSFCMCPGGYVIPTPTEPGHLNVNGMSNSNRGGKFANAALVVTIQPEDFYLETPGDLAHHGELAGIYYQREWERRAFELGGSSYCAPAQRLTDLVESRPSSTLPERTSYRPGLVATDLAPVLPTAVYQSLQQAVQILNRGKFRGYLTEEAVLIGVETTTSSPIRLVRDETRQSPGFRGLFPTGEGGGYSGGIVSSAIEGVETAWAALEHVFELALEDLR